MWIFLFNYFPNGLGVNFLHLLINSLKSKLEDGELDSVAGTRKKSERKWGLDKHFDWISKSYACKAELTLFVL